MTGKDYLKPKLNEARKRTMEPTNIRDFVIPETAKEIGRNKQYWIHTYGCQGNVADSEKIAGVLESVGFAVSASLETADLIVLNTCAIRANAENHVFGELGRLKQYKETNPELLIAVGGCMPQEEVVVEKILKTYHQVDIVFGTHNLHRLIEFLERVLREKNKIVEVVSEQGDIVEHLPTVRKDKHKAWVNIMFGCDEFCTYCIVSYTRGKERSRRLEHIIEEIRGLIADGCQEVTLLGQNVNSYGLDFPEKTPNFSQLLTEISALPISRVRFTTSHPKDFGDDLIDVLAKHGNLMPYIHLPVQSGSDKILKAMNRKYSKETYETLIASIRAKIPSVSITTDVIVGFPGETESDFQMTLDLVANCRFDGAYTFVFSPRSGTPAAKYPDDVDMATKKARLNRLNELVNSQFAEGNRRFLNQTVKVLVDGWSKQNKRKLSGYTEHNKLVNFSGEESMIGKIVDVLIIESKSWSLEGEIVHA